MRERAFFVCAHNAGAANHIGGKIRGQLALGSLSSRESFFVVKSHILRRVPPEVKQAALAKQPLGAPQ